MSDTREATAASIRDLAKQAFADHVLTQVGEGRWLCRKPGTTAYYFTVITAPYRVIVVGDIGEAILAVSDHDALSWLRGFGSGKMDRSHDYMISKIVGRKDHFYVGDALANLRDSIKELERDLADGEPGGKYLAKLRDFLDDVEDAEDEHEWLEAYRTSDLEYENLIEGIYGPAPKDYWTAECLCWFARALMASEKMSEPEVASAQPGVDGTIR